jgi:hypothetical protein
MGEAQATVHAEEIIKGGKGNEQAPAVSNIERALVNEVQELRTNGKAVSGKYLHVRVRTLARDTCDFDVQG